MNKSNIFHINLLLWPVLLNQLECFSSGEAVERVLFISTATPEPAHAFVCFISLVTVILGPASRRNEILIPEKWGHQLYWGLPGKGMALGD